MAYEVKNIHVIDATMVRSESWGFNIASLLQGWLERILEGISCVQKQRK